jgi:protein involved in polysaccharide export with SLBB domain
MLRSRSINSFFAAFALSIAPCLADGSRLHVGDTVTVLVFNHPELSGDRVVRSNGTIAIPLAGSVVAAGFSANHVADALATNLHRYLPYAAVDVQVKSEGAAISIAGWPYPIPDGTLKFVPDETLSSAIAAIRPTAVVQAPGVPNTLDPFHSRIDMRSVFVRRDGSQLGPFDMVALGGVGAAGPVLKPGDTVEFRNKPIAVSVSGAVREPGLAYLDRNEQLSDVINQVGGVTDDASASDLQVTRDGTTQKITVADPAYHAPATNGERLTIGVAPEVLVTGVVLKPGTTQLRNDSSLLSAISNAGGPSVDSDLSHIRVIRGRQVTQYDVTAVAHGDFSQNPQLQDGDEVIVGRGHRIDVVVLASLLQSLSYLILRY